MAIFKSLNNLTPFTPLEFLTGFIPLSMIGISSYHEGEMGEEGLAPLLDTLHVGRLTKLERRQMLKESEREAKPLLNNQFPFPLIRGRG